MKKQYRFLYLSQGFTAHQAVATLAEAREQWAEWVFLGYGANKVFRLLEDGRILQMKVTRLRDSKWRVSWPEVTVKQPEVVS